jgi:hypothetical protein
LNFSYLAPSLVGSSQYIDKVVTLAHKLVLNPSYKTSINLTGPLNLTFCDLLHFSGLLCATRNTTRLWPEAHTVSPSQSTQPASMKKHRPQWGSHLGLRTSVPDTTIDELRPWYPTGKCSLPTTEKEHVIDCKDKQALIECAKTMQQGRTIIPHSRGFCCNGGVLDVHG